jgi:hypothetical protein
MRVQLPSAFCDGDGQVCERPFINVEANCGRVHGGICVVPLLSDLACLAALDALEQRSILPGDCDAGLLADEGLIEPGSAPATWRLTVKGRLTLANLRSLERERQKG